MARSASRPGNAGTSAGRVIAGTARGIRLIGAGEGTRPLGDRLKQSLFAILEPEIRGARFLDAFAGSGAAGIEALSRGAAAAVFIERNGAAAWAIEANLAAAGLAGHASLVRGDAVAWLERHDRAADPFQAVLLDPPYDRPELLLASLERIARAGPGGILDAHGVAVAKRFGKAPLSARIGLLGSAREERFGDTILSFYRWADEVDA